MIFSPNSRVWVYANTKKIEDDAQLASIKKEVNYFAAQWSSHNNLLKAQAEVLYERFVVLMVDSSQYAEASGCSIDNSVRFLQQLESAYQLDLFNRLYFTYLDDKNEPQTVSSTTFATLYKEGIINDDTLIFDTLVNTKEKLENEFIKKLKDSLLKRIV